MQKNSISFRKKYYIPAGLISVILIIMFSPSLSIREPQRKVRVISGRILKSDDICGDLDGTGLLKKDIVGISDVLGPFIGSGKGDRVGLYELVMSSAGAMMSFRYFANTEDLYRIERSSDDNMVVFWEKASLERRFAGLNGSVGDSIFVSLKENGVSMDMIKNFTDIFSCKIDFLAESSPGDRFKLIWERYYRDGSIVFEGQILAAEYDGKNTGLHHGICFIGPDKNISYYSLTGESIRRQFLRSPLTYKRISSGYSENRMHPILRRVRPHKGIDYAASAGTPVIAIGDGYVVYAGWKGGYGKYIKIKHDDVYVTAYGHLSGYSAVLKKGIEVKQGDIIGYVGSTGLSTGPHLDFRIQKDGEYVDLLKLKSPVSTQITATCWKEFKKLRDKWTTALAVLPEGISEIGHDD